LTAVENPPESKIVLSVGFLKLHLYDTDVIPYLLHGAGYSLES
jgi:hypothetical protein